MAYKSFYRSLNSGLLSLALSITCLADENQSEQRIRVIEPDERSNNTKAAAIDNENFELGFFLGNLSVEDFGSNLVTGIEFGYHLSDDWLLQLNYGISNVEPAAFEPENQPFLADSDRDFEFYGLTGGYQLIHGRSFFGSRKKFNSHLYVLAGAEQVNFAANSELGFTFGLSYRMVFTDWMTANLDFREHVFERTFIGDTKRTLNSELRIGINALF